MPVQSHRNGWRVRKKHAGQWFIGPVRRSVQAAEEDSRSLDEDVRIWQRLTHKRRWTQ